MLYFTVCPEKDQQSLVET